MGESWVGIVCQKAVKLKKKMPALKEIFNRLNCCYKNGPVIVIQISISSLTQES